jgi:hypothetical protein
MEQNARRANNGPLSELVTKIIYQFALALIEGLVDHRQVIQKGLLQLGGRHFAGMGKVALDWEEYMNTAVNMVNYQGGKNYITSAADAWTQELSVLANYAKLELDNEVKTQHMNE